MQRQRTLKDSFSVEGKGLHTGLHLHASFHPTSENFGIKIQRTDVMDMPVIDVLTENVCETQRGTVVCNGDVKVSTIEHAIASLYASGIWNCLIKIDGPEFPILDGSALPYVQEILRTGIREQDAEQSELIVTKPISFVDEHSGSSITIEPADKFSVCVLTDYHSPVLPASEAFLDDISHFNDTIAASRTFVFVREIEPLFKLGKIKGGDLDNAIVIYDRMLSQDSLDRLADLIGVEHINAEQLGYLNHRPLVWDNECARHKLLDLLGDLALIGMPVVGKVTATRPGHTINNKFARIVRQTILNQTNS